ncbi:hypothetical protein L0657_27280 [Dyadobacter sp. CY345]|uniref:hypothetical protein n=1 Tax=Dyadobacter sp. CY345 TaxID=2909335 RepID=UPI001F474839|nr:hypothetical protein [Dyadobacter sp. CY345]MCF2447688.1 hypothetical protein [Dyadobacter sp. CY345]
MKKSLFPLSVLTAFLLASCNSSPTQNSALDTKSSDRDSTFNICYSSILKKDTVMMNALMYGDSIKGSLGYKLYEKDENNGSFFGKMFGDTLKAMCTFKTATSESVQQVIFLRNDTLLIQASGEHIEQNGKIVFSKPDQVRFDGLILSKVPCK